MVEGVTSERTLIVSGISQRSVLCPLLFILYTREMFEQMEHRLCAYADYSTLLAVVHNQADRPVVTDYLNRELALIQEWCNHWLPMLNLNKTKAFVVNRSRNVNPGDLVLSVVDGEGGLFFIF